MSNGAPALPRRLTLRPGETAQALGVSDRTLRKWMRDEGLPYFRMDSAVLIPLADLREWISERTTSQRSSDAVAADILREL